MKSKLIPILAATAAFILACDEQPLIISPYHCSGEYCEDSYIFNPDAKDSEDGNSSNPGGSPDDISEQPPSNDPENETMPCKDEDDCANVPDSCDICTAGNRKCNGSTLFVCKKNARNCLTWTVQEDCASSNSWCDNSSLACTQCEETCAPGMQKCRDNGIATCSLDTHGCAVWNVSTPCSGDQHCDDITTSCVSGCVSNCHENERKCDKNQIMSCQRSEQGCLVWQAEKTCDFGETCTGASPVCEKVCGNECDPFSIVILPDTQHYVLTTNGIHKKQTQWIADNAKKENIRMVMHMGDVTDGNRKTQLERAIAAHNVLAEAGIPYTISTGNHDYKEGDSGVSFVSRDRSLFTKYFNDAYIQNGYHDSSWFHGFNSANMYATFNVGHLKFAVIALEFFPRKDMLCWAENLISNELRDHYVIITTHGYLTNGASTDTKYGSGSNGDISTGALGNDIWNELVSRHSNIIMVSCGHVSDSEHRDRKGNTGNTIHETLVDYQSEKPCESSSCHSTACGTIKDGGNGWLRLLKIDPVNTKNADGTLIPNVTATTISVLDYYSSQKTMYCSSVNTESKNYYAPKPTDNDHNYKFTLDFATPLEYKYSNGDNLAFTTRDVNEMKDDTLDGNQYAPAIAVNRSTGAFVVTWEDDADNNDIRSIQARIFCPGGCSDIQQFEVASGSESLHNPDIAMDKAGNFAVVWETSSSDIYMRGFDAKGNETFKSQKVCSSSGKRKKPAIAMSADGDFVVTWEDTSVSNELPQVYFKGFHADGSQNIAEQNIHATVEGLQRKPDVAMADDGTFVITWEDDTDQNDAYQINAKGYTADGKERIPEFTVNTVGTGQQLNPSIGMNQSGTFFIAFEDDSDGNGKFLIIGRGFDKDGNEIVKDTTLSASNEETEDPVVCVAEDGKAVFGWTAKALNSNDVQRRVLTTKHKLEDEERASRFYGGPQKSPNIGCSADGRYIFVYSDDRVESGLTNIHARGFNG